MAIRYMRETRNRVSQHPENVELLRATLLKGTLPVAKPVMVVISGLPGSGKSYFSRRLVEKVPLLVLESDVLRKALFPSPSYTNSESASLFRACHALIYDLLGQGVPLLLDATNLLDGHRERLYHIADLLGAKLILLHLKAPPEVVYQRLKGRSERRDQEDQSSADWEVYQRMSSTAEAIKRDHFVVDTSRDLSPAIAKVVREITRSMRTH